MTLKFISTLGFGLLLTAGTALAQGNAPATAQTATPDNTASEPATQIAATQSDGVDLLTIYRMAMRNDPTIRMAKADYLATTQQKPLARSSLLPSLSLSASTSGNHNTNPHPPTNFVNGQPIPGISKSIRDTDTTEYGLSLTQTIFNWAAYKQLKQADKIVTQAKLQYEAAKQDLMIRVATAYFQVLAKKDALAAQIASRKALKEQLDQAQQRYDVGLIAITDVQESQAGYDQAVAAVIAGQQALALAEEQLRAIIGERISNLAAPEGQLPLMPPDPTNPKQWVQAAMQSNPKVIAARIQSAIAQDNIEIARAARYPTLSLSANYSNSDGSATRTLRGAFAPPPSTSQNGSYGYNWRLSLSVPLFNGGQIAAEVQQRVYQHRSAVEQSELTARQAERKTRDAYLSVISSISSVRALRQAVKSAQTALDATEAGLQVGTRTSVDVIVSQQSLSQAKTNYAQARYQYIVNLLILQQVAGSLSADDMEHINSWLD